MDAREATQQNKSAQQFDERRGKHLLRPGDAIRCRDVVWDVIGVYLSTDRRHSTVGVVLPADLERRERRIPLIIVEAGCEIFLRGEGPAAH